MINARSLAYQILLHLNRKAAHPDRLIRAMLERHSRLEERDRALLTEMVYGVLRWQGRLDWHIDQLSRVSAKKIAPEIRILLRLALYQILILDRIPPHAAVNETVNLAKATQPPHVVGFVNALLREALRRGADWNWPSEEEDPAGRLAVMTSYPPWFIQKCLKELGADETSMLCRASNTIAPMTLRVNTLRTSASEVLQWLRGRDMDAEPSPYLPDAVRITALRQDISRLPIFQEGWIQVQDEASQLISHLAAPQPGERILDLCAGFGGKSTHLGILMGNVGEVLAVDHSPWKLEELRQNAARQGVGIVKILAGDVLELKPEAIGTFDRVLLDAPCSGFGALRRKPDIKWTRHLKDPYRFSQLQKSLLAHASRFVKEGGVMVYATCTFFREEDEGVAEDFSAAHPGWDVQPAGSCLPEGAQSMVEGVFFKSWPHRHGTDGFFGARWRRCV
ncbi:16S rRNA (cytosine(967)-C(5))-methyltransferase RsmB [Desulforhabdus sp. TSK]|uniref:16S rRNA (cytosine(967)-C(5))-methyltransferase RsmB n=1 Tax=Desulforhabdus sp. TSK TaxID=2925014 RepID=UPI001FC8876A|nr:16S rRNA (cytosine(967)-C(5))-methyltransferase RsmB [Desulforhabdus sp. TSK]GKT08211.1 ribosomal RNA small subunit methyltransferase B [Desulforhabdus sp. TSK]